MRHVTAIKDLLSAGDRSEAATALDTLLELGPNNMEALKLKAMLFASEGRFAEEEQVWLRVLEIDREDQDAIMFVFKKQLEDREHFYFTDDLPGGGRRFLAYPRVLIKISLFGLMGCVAFLMLTRMAERFPDLNLPVVILSSFALLVMSPWLAIIYTYFRSIRTISVSKLGIEVTTRLKTFRFRWTELATVSLSHSKDPQEPDLRLILIPKDEAVRPITIDMNEATSSIRARTHFVHSLKGFCGDLTHESFEQLAPRLARTRRF